MEWEWQSARAQCMFVMYVIHLGIMYILCKMLWWLGMANSKGIMHACYAFTKGKK